MIFVVCPNCGHRFPILPVNSRGWCRCGMDYELAGAEIRWTPDPHYCPNAQAVTETFAP